MLRQWVFVVSFLAVASLPTLRAQGPQLPPQAEAVFDGELEVQYEDSNTEARLLHFLHTTDGRRLRLQFRGAPTELLTGSRVRAHGSLQNNTLMLTSDASLETVTPASAYTFGVQQTLVVLINFLDNATQPYTAATAESVTFDQTRNFYLENSYEQTALNGTVAGWFTIAATSASCDASTWASLADQAAANAGVALANYTRRIYGFPNASACSWWGMGTVGGGSSTSPSRAWINGSYALRVVAHELGHNFGDYHSHSSSCDSSGCTTSEYGDDRDIMGATTAHLNAFQKERLGWLNYGTSPPIISASQTNTYWIDAFEPYATSPKAVKILKATDANGKRTWYYIESRARLGFDSGLIAGVVVHTGSEATGNSSYQIDLEPASTTFDRLLDPGQTFADPVIGLSITTLSSDVTGALVNVSFGGTSTPCARANPTVTLSSSQSQGVKAGTTVSYTLSVKSNDSASCTAAAFSLTATAPSGWTAALASSSLTIGPSSTTTTTLQVTSAATSTGGSYTISASATNGGDTTKSGSASATYAILTPLTVKVATGQASYTTNQTIKISATVLAGTSAAAGASVVFTVTRSDGSTLSGTATTDAAGVASYSARVKPKDPAGTYQVNATATLNGAIGSAATSVTVK